MNIPPIVTRFAPSPTGFLHIGGVRTALYNVLFAKKFGGKCLLRIEDTDRERSTKEAKDAILEGLKWLGLSFDGEVVYQSKRIARHQEIAMTLLEKGKAYKCFCTPEELEAMRVRARKEGRTASYEGTWRDKDPSTAPSGTPYVVRLKVNQSLPSLSLQDEIQGEVRVARDTLDDYVLLRKDGTPTYMLSVVVDDHDMEVSHIIRGVDHLTNSFRQMVLYEALGWAMPLCAHIGLLHGEDGKKLSKRHGALSVGAYKDQGFLPQALVQALATTGWSGMGEGTYSLTDMIPLFSLDKVGKNAAQFSFEKLKDLNAHHMRSMSCQDLFTLTKESFLASFSKEALSLYERALPSLVKRSKTLNELVDKSSFFINTPSHKFSPSDKEFAHLSSLLERLSSLSDEEWNAPTIALTLKEFAQKHELSFGKIGKPLRLALTGALASPGDIADIPIILGKERTLARIENALDSA